MIRFLQPDWFWAMTLLPLVVLWRGRQGPVAAVEYSDVSLARDIARRTRSRIGGIVWLLPIIAAALMIVGLARPQRTHSQTSVTANGIDIVLALDISGSMQALDFKVGNVRVNRVAVVKSVLPTASCCTLAASGTVIVTVGPASVTSSRTATPVPAYRLTAL